MVTDLVLAPVATNVVGDICPRPQPVDLGALQEEKLLVGAPFSVEYRERVLLDDSVWMCCGLMRVAGRAVGEAQDAEVILVAGAVRASNANLRDTRI